MSECGREKDKAREKMRDELKRRIFNLERMIKFVHNNRWCDCPLVDDDKAGPYVYEPCTILNDPVPS